MTQATDPCVLLTTCGDRATADALARALVEQRLAACVQIMPIHSTYAWEGAVQQEEELLLLIKSRASLYPQIEAFLTEHHPYEVPELLQLPVQQGLGKYLAWVEQNTGEPAASR